MTERISTLWIVVLINMVFADILNFITPGRLAEMMTGYAGSLRITDPILLVFALLLEVPIAMIYLSRVLNPRANRVVNIVACVLTTVFTIGGTLNPHYVFFAAAEVACMVLIIRYVTASPTVRSR